MAVMPWKFESSYPHHTLPKALYGKSFIFGVVAQLIERYVRIVEVVGLSPISSTRIKSANFADYFFISFHRRMCFWLDFNTTRCNNKCASDDHRCEA